MLKPLTNLSLNTSQKPKQRPSNFIESLKDLGNSFKKQTQEATFGISKTASEQILGTPSNSQQANQNRELNANEPFNFEDYLRARERQIAWNEQQKYNRRFEEETLVFHRRQEKAKAELKSVQEELKKLAKATSNLSQEIKKAVFMAPVDPGTYHENLLERIKNLIMLAIQKISESQTWLHICNCKAKKRSFYWFNVQNSGTKFMLSQERYMVTQVG